MLKWNARVVALLFFWVNVSVAYAADVPVEDATPIVVGGPDNQSQGYSSAEDSYQPSSSPRIHRNNSQPTMQNQGGTSDQESLEQPITESPEEPLESKSAPAPSSSPAAPKLTLADRATQLEKQQSELATQVNDLKQQVNQLQNQIDQLNQRAAQAPAAQSVASSASSPATNIFKSTSQATDKRELQAYQKGYDSLKNRDLARAKTAFYDYLSAFPHGKFVSQSHYWLGEIYLKQNMPARAEAEFKIVTANPDNPKYTEAMLKLGFAYIDQANYPQARKQFNDVKQKFPDTTAAQLATAKLQELTQQGH